MRRLIILFVTALLALTTVACGSQVRTGSGAPSPAPDPFVGYWKETKISKGFSGMTLTVSARTDGKYAVTWDNGSYTPDADMVGTLGDDFGGDLGQSKLVAEQTSDGVYKGTGNDDSVFRILTATELQVSYSGAEGQPVKMRFTKQAGPPPTPSASPTATASAPSGEAGVGDPLASAGNDSKLETTLTKTKRLPAASVYGIDIHPALYGVQLAIKNVGQTV